MRIFYFYKSGVYKYTTGQLEGGHAVTIIGWDDATRSWLVRNSWGTTWGEQGYFRVDWSDKSGVGRSTWGMEVAGSEGFVAIKKIRDRDVLSGTTALEVVSTISGTKYKEWLLRKDGKTVLNGRARINTSQVSSGVYELVAVATHSKGVTMSAPRQVYLLNEKLTGSIGFANLKPGQKLVGKHLMEINVDSKPVPIQSVRFSAKPLAGGETFEKITSNAAAKMAMNWRVSRLKPGDYEVQLEAFSGNQTLKSPAFTVTIEPEPKKEPKS